MEKNEINKCALLELVERAMCTGSDSIQLDRGYNWTQIYQNAVAHKVSTFVLSQVKKVEKFQRPDVSLLSYWENSLVRENLIQRVRNDEIRGLLPLLEEKGIQCIFYKGIILSCLYPKGSMRIYGDEDIIVKRADMEKLKSILLNRGYYLLEQSEDKSTCVMSLKDVITFDIHTSICKKQDDINAKILESLEIYDDEKLIKQNAYGIELTTMAHGPTLLYMVYNIAAHFKKGSVALCELVDIALYVNKYIDKLDLKRLWINIGALGYTSFAKSIFSICINHFNVDDRIMNGVPNEKEDISEILLRLIISSRATYINSYEDEKLNYIDKVMKYITDKFLKKEEEKNSYDDYNDGKLSKEMVMKELDLM